MAYFPNGSTGDKYQARWCDICVNWHESSPGADDWGCPIIDLHMDGNYKQNEKTGLGKFWKKILDQLIPTGKDLFPEKCRMFIEKPDKEERHE